MDASIEYRFWINIMMRHLVLFTQVFLLAVGFTAHLQAQDPFGGGGTPVAPAANQPAQPDDDWPEEKDPGLLAVRALNATTAEELAYAARTVLQMGRPDEAKRYLEKLLALQPDANAILDIQRKLGTGFFLRIAQNEELQPEGKQLGEAVLGVMRAVKENRTRLRAIAERAASTTGNAQRQDLVDLKRAGDAGLEALVSVLADDSQSNLHSTIQELIVQWGPTATNAMIGALDGPENVRVAAIQVLAALRAKSSLPLLVGPAANERAPAAEHEAAKTAVKELLGRTVTRSEVEKYLWHRANRLLSGAELAGKANDQGLVSLWVWNAEEGVSRPVMVTAPDAGFIEASRVAGELVSLEPNNTDYQTLFLATSLEGSKRLQGMDQPISVDAGSPAELALQGGRDQLERVLAYSLQHDLAGAATACCELMGETKDPELLASRQGTKAPLVQAVDNADRHVRHAATMAIMQIDPQKPYAGSSRVAESLGFLATSQGTPLVLIGHPRLDKAMNRVGQFAELGYDAATAQTGRQLVELASRDADIELILLSGNIDQPAVYETLQAIRKLESRRHIPVAIIAREDQLSRARDVADRDPYAIVVAAPFDTATLSADVRELLRLAGRNRVMPVERLQQSEEAMQHLARLAAEQDKYGYYDLTRYQTLAQSSLDIPGLSDSAAELLGHLATPQAQVALVQFASQVGHPLEARQAAVKGFERAVQRTGLKLSRQQVLDAYHRYNASESLDDASQQVLGSILDIMEKKITEAD